MGFGEKLKVLIKTKYRTIGDCADSWGVNYTQLSQYLNGKKISYEILMKVITDFPDVDLNWLLRDKIEDDEAVKESQESYKHPMNNDEIVGKIEALLADLKAQLTQN